MSEETANIEQSLFLIIDRDKRTRSFISRALQKNENAIVDHADNALQAIEQIGEKNYDAVFADSHDSVIKAAEIIKTFKDQAKFRANLYLLIMKEFDIRRTIDLLETGFQGFITKPFHHEIILQKLQLLKQHMEADHDSAIQLPLLLLADGNERYRKHLAAVLATQYRVIEAVT